MKLCVGCGANHRFDGYVHVDANPVAAPDVCMNACDYVQGLADDTITDVIAWHVLEHIPWEILQPFINDLWRASKHGAVWSIRVPHCTSIHAANPQHRNVYSTTFWDFWKVVGPQTGERYGVARMVVDSTKLRILAHATGLVPRSVSRAMPNWVFNRFGRGWQMFCERFWPFRFDEIEWVCRMVKTELNKED